MCGRYAVTTDPARLAAEIDARNEVPEGFAATPNYNGAPSTTVLTVVDRHEHNAAAEPVDRRVRAMRWGLIPPWTTDLGAAPLLFNARAETVRAKPAFRAAAKNKRCLFPMDGWYEWKTGPTGANGKPTKIPFYMSPEDGSRLYMGGLWSAWRSPAARAADDAAAWTSSATILTTEAVGAHREIHDRMPLIMPVEHWAAWLDPDRPADPDLLAPPAEALAEAIAIREVSPRVNRVAHNGPELLDPVS
ncbi:MAG: SOS response-associated peptidase [Gordonia sp. (in: high G+C Gram-positive bacteria)]|uniref:SOS response-associated peptidase n=1 Tax=Gordonia sp. (in: high G+C Gram-positive bacteria) TaxID=84139 RepID=UPI003BB4EB2C